MRASRSESHLGFAFSRALVFSKGSVSERKGPDVRCLQARGGRHAPPGAPQPGHQSPICFWMARRKPCRLVGPTITDSPSITNSGPGAAGSTGSTEIDRLEVVLGKDRFEICHEFLRLPLP